MIVHIGTPVRGGERWEGGRFARIFDICVEQRMMALDSYYRLASPSDPESREMSRDCECFRALAPLLLSRRQHERSDALRDVFEYT